MSAAEEVIAAAEAVLLDAVGLEVVGTLRDLARRMSDLADQIEQAVEQP